MIAVTSAERDEINLLFAFVREWRADDARWKELHGAEHDRQDTRLTTLETQNKIESALETDARDRGLSNRSKFAIAVTFAVAAGNAIVQVALAVLK